MPFFGQLAKEALFLPPDVVLPASSVPVLLMYREVLADRVLRRVQPVQLGLTQDIPIRVCQDIIDTPDA